MTHTQTERDILIDDINHLMTEYSSIKELIEDNAPIEELTPSKLVNLYHSILCKIYQ